MLRAILNKSWRQHPTRHQLYGHLPPITKTIQVRRTRHAGHCWRSRDELIRDVLLWIPTHGRAKAGRPARTYIQQLCEDTGCCPEDLPRAMNDREEWWERVRDICATSATWWWWWWWWWWCSTQTVVEWFGWESTAYHKGGASWKTSYAVFMVGSTQYYSFWVFKPQLDTQCRLIFITTATCEWKSFKKIPLHTPKKGNAVLLKITQNLVQ